MSTPRQPAEGRPPVSEAGEGQTDEQERHKRKRAQNWKGKAEVLEQVNELISELDTISSSIAAQVSLRCLASEKICLASLL